MRMVLFGWLLLLKNIGPLLALACVGVVVTRKPDAMARAFRRAMEIAGYSVKAWSCDLGYTNNAHATRMLDGEKPLTFAHVSVAPREVLQWFSLLLAKEYGIPQEADTARHIHERTL
jgi:hypothetical protein